MQFGTEARMTAKKDKAGKTASVELTEADLEGVTGGAQPIPRGVR